MSEKKIYDISILIVEDEYEIKTVLEKMLKRRVERVFSAFNGLEALDIYCTSKIDLIITDVDMPKMNGIELISEIRKNDKDIPIILLTGLKDLNILVQAVNLHVDLFLQKPVSIERLVDKIEEITKVKALENELKNKNQELNTIILEADTGIATMDFDGNFIEVNRAYAHMLGYEIEEMKLLNCKTLGMSNDANSANALEIVRKEGHISKFQKICRKKDGDSLHVEMSLTKLPLKEQCIVVINSVEDKLLLKKLNESLQMIINNQFDTLSYQEKILIHQSKLAAMGEMLDVIAHQWKQPLSVMKMYVEMLKYGYQDGLMNEEFINSYVDKFNNQINHAIHTLDEFRLFFRPNTDEKEFSMAEVIKSTLLLVKDEFIKNTVEFHLDIDVEANIIGNANEFKHIILNIINNAKDAFIENNIQSRTILIKIDKTTEYIALEISDNAGGIPESIIDDIFKQNVTTKAEGKGTGVGLYISSQIAEKVGGKLSVSNIENGAKFTFKKFIE